MMPDTPIIYRLRGETRGLLDIARPYFLHVDYELYQVSLKNNPYYDERYKKDYMDVSSCKSVFNMIIKQMFLLSRNSS